MAAHGDTVKGFLVGMFFTMAFLLATAALAGPGESGRSQLIATAGIAIDAPHTLVLERDAQEHMLRMARIEAERAADLAAERTLRLYAVVAGVVTVALCGAAGLLISRRPQRVVVVHRIEGQGVVRIEETGQVVRAQEALVQWDRR